MSDVEDLISNLQSQSIGDSSSGAVGIQEELQRIKYELEQLMSGITSFASGSSNDNHSHKGVNECLRSFESIRKDLETLQSKAHRFENDIQLVIQEIING
jgi:archaellum component FlaC